MMRLWPRGRDELILLSANRTHVRTAIGEGMPELGIDFKRYFTIPTDEVYFRIRAEAQRRSRLRSPYLEHLSNRFYSFQSLSLIHI